MSFNINMNVPGVSVGMNMPPQQYGGYSPQPQYGQPGVSMNMGMPGMSVGMNMPPQQYGGYPPQPQPGMSVNMGVPQTHVVVQEHHHVVHQTSQPTFTQSVGSVTCPVCTGKGGLGK